jgi:hypothetical protein
MGVGVIEFKPLSIVSTGESSIGVHRTRGRERMCSDGHAVRVWVFQSGVLLPEVVLKPIIIIIMNMLTPVQQNRFTHLRVRVFFAQSN